MNKLLHFFILLLCLSFFSEIYAEDREACYPWLEPFLPHIIPEELIFPNQGMVVMSSFDENMRDFAPFSPPGNHDLAMSHSIPNDVMNIYCNGNSWDIAVAVLSTPAGGYGQLFMDQ